jgi:tetratricopeptide (TPR) repeat protein
MDEKEKALKCFNRAIEVDPNFVEAWRFKGMVLSDLQDMAGALRSLDKAIKLEPGVAVYWHEKGRLLQMMGRQKEAKASLAEGVRLDRQGDSGYPYWPLGPET